MPLWVEPTLSSGKALGERSDVDVPSVAEEDPHNPRVEVVLIIFSDCFRRAYNGARELGTERDWTRVEGVEGFSRSGDTCLSTLFSSAWPVTMQLKRKGALREPR